jgi:hypothetical protein
VGVEVGDEDVGRRGWKADGVSQDGRDCMGQGSVSNVRMKKWI